MSDKEITEQTAFMIAGIPTPPDQENIGSTDGISEAVEAMMDKIEDTFYSEDARQENDRE
ncbi:hypothetical protein ACFFNY_24925 [Paenibacillus hodogayensis]|uniref:DUF4025 domain-containing protein n=1 Tax=Paenibacillus hodogayensis TaxID=279208 RepID=A0ABV5W2P3_9BACL